MPLLASLQLGTVLIIVVLIALPVGALVFAMGAGNALQKIGKGDFALEQDFPQSSGAPVHAVSTEVREEEIRQMVQARSDRGVAKGREALDVEAEVDKLLATDVGRPKPRRRSRPSRGGPPARGRSERAAGAAGQGAPGSRARDRPPAPGPREPGSIRSRLWRQATQAMHATG